MVNRVGIAYRLAVFSVDKRDSRGGAESGNRAGHTHKALKLRDGSVSLNRQELTEEASATKLDFDVLSTLFMAYSLLGMDSGSFRALLGEAEKREV